jgi:hypothetical protein
MKTEDYAMKQILRTLILAAALFAVMTSVLHAQQISIPTTAAQIPGPAPGTAIGQPWTGEKAFNPFNEFGEFSHTDRVWAGWLYATDADTGVWKWRLKSNYPIFGGVTPTAGGLVEGRPSGRHYRRSPPRLSACRSPCK